MRMRIGNPLLAKALGAVVVSAFALALLSCTPGIPYRTTKIEEAPQCRQVFKQNDELTQGDGTIAKSLANDPCWLRSVEEHLEYDLITAEFDDQGWLQGTSGERRPRPDHIDDLLAKLEQIYNENQKNGLSIVVYVHGWHHNAHPEDADVVNFRKFLGQIKASDNGRTLSEDPNALNGAKRIYSQTQAAAKGPRVVGIYVGWRGESIPVRGLNLLTFWERKDTAEHVAQGSVRELFQQLDYIRDCGRTELDWKSTRRKLSERERLKEGTVGSRNVRMLTIGHSFGGLVTYRALSSEFIGYAVRASADEYVSRLGDMVVIVNPAFEGARYEPLHVAGQRIPSLKDNQLPTIIIATTQRDWATRYAFPAARALNTLFEKQPGAEYDATVKAVGHNARYRTHTLSRCDSSTNPLCKKTCQPSVQKLQAADKALSKEQNEILGEAELMQTLGQQGFQNQTTYLCSELELTTNGELRPPYNPFWVVATTGDLMTGHNDVFNERFVSFFRQMYLGITLARLKNPAAPRCTR